MVNDVPRHLSVTANATAPTALSRTALAGAADDTAASRRGRAPGSSVPGPSQEGLAAQAWRQPRIMLPMKRSRDAGEAQDRPSLGDVLASEEKPVSVQHTDSFISKGITPVPLSDSAWRRLLEAEAAVAGALPRPASPASRVAHSGIIPSIAVTPRLSGTPQHSGVPGGVGSERLDRGNDTAVSSHHVDFGG